MVRRPLLVAAATLATALTAPADVGAQDEVAGAGSYGDEVVVSYRDDVGIVERVPLLERAGVDRTVEEVAAADAEVVRVEGDPAEAAARLEASTKVDYAEPNYLVSTAAAPNDDYFGDLWGLDNRGQTGGRRGADIGALAGWRSAGLRRYPQRGGAPVAVIDTGVDRTHPDLAGRVAACAVARPLSDGLERGQCSDDSGHGTHVTGILGAAADNGAGIAGVAFNSPLIVCRAFGGVLETARVSDVARCMGWSRRQGARVISMSFASPYRSQTIETAVGQAWRGGRRSGAVLVAAAGNGGAQQAVYPAAFRQVISVSATTDRDGAASFSNRHGTVELSAPGDGILSAVLGGDYARLSGTSMAVPHVAGVAAQLRGRDRDASAARIRGLLRRSAVDLGRRGHDARFGFGRVDLERAIRR